MHEIWKVGFFAPLVLAAPLIGQQRPIEDNAAGVGGDAVLTTETTPAWGLLSSIADAELRSLVADTLARNPEIARRLARARAAERRVPRVRALPDPIAGVTAWLRSPETRTGPQVLTLSWTQVLPWLSKLDLAEQAALLDASTAYLEVEATRLGLVTEVRRLYFELAFLSRQEGITRDYLDHLQNHEELARARYETGGGSSQEVLKIQAEITVGENLLLDIEQRRVHLEATINALRDRPASADIFPARVSDLAEVELNSTELVVIAELERPEISTEDARIAAAEVRLRRAEKEYLPDFKIGLTYTFVKPREDTAGIVSPPAGNGDDILGILGGVNVPIWRERRRAAVEEAAALSLAAVEARRDVLAEIEAEIGDLMQRIPLTWRQLRLLEDVLIVQAEESVTSAEAGYVSGALDALDLLDAEHVLFESQTAIARAQADYAIRLAQLEGAIGSTLPGPETTE